jgi:hypothetical protein
VAVAILVVAFGLPSVRRRLLPSETVFDDVRTQGAIEGAEAERARVARDLHDVPLQELAAVIRRVEVLEGAEREVADLRAIAEHLREVAIDLRPPVLDDLGLPAALEFLAEQLTRPDLVIELRLEASTGLARALRPPAEVELAVYRIVAEAVANAARHSGGSIVRVEGEVSARNIELAVQDNGRPTSTREAGPSSRLPHLGVSIMKQRAAAIDADLLVDPRPTGMLVRLAWQA